MRLTLYRRRFEMSSFDRSHAHQSVGSQRNRPRSGERSYRLFQIGCVILALLTVAFLSTSVHAQDNWPRFRGPNAGGVAADRAGLPTTWTTTENVKWAFDVPGWGWSSPVVWGDRVFLTSVVSEETNVTPSKGLYLGQGVREPRKGIHHWVVYCFDLNTGRQLWKHETHIGRPRVPRHPKNTYASETPTTDGQRLYVLFGDVGLYCYESGRQAVVVAEN